MGFILFHASGIQNIGCVAHSLYCRVSKERKMDKFIPDGIYIVYIYIQSWKQCALLVITKMALWQLMLLGTWCTCTSCTPCAQVHELQQNHCGNNREGTLFSWLHIYITPILLLWDLSTVCRGSVLTSYINIYTVSVNIYIYTLTDWAIRPWVQLALTANFVQILQLHHLFSVTFHFSYCLRHSPRLF